MNIDDNTDKTLERVVKYITRMLKHNIPEARIRQALMHNKQRGAEELFAQAFSLVEQRAKAAAEAKRREEAAKKALAVKQAQEAQKAKEATLRSLTESGTNELGESETILLHVPEKPKTEPEEVAVTITAPEPKANPETTPIGSTVSEPIASYQQQYPASQSAPYPPVSWQPMASANNATYTAYPGTPVPADANSYRYTAGQRYGLRQAVKEAVTAVRANPIAFAVTVAVGYVMASGLTVLVILAANSLFKLRYSFLITPPTKLLSTLLGSIGLHLVVGVLAYSLILVTTSLAL